MIQVNLLAQNKDGHYLSVTAAGQNGASLLATMRLNSFSWGVFLIGRFHSISAIQNKVRSLVDSNWQNSKLRTLYSHGLIQVSSADGFEVFLSSGSINRFLCRALSFKDAQKVLIQKLHSYGIYRTVRMEKSNDNLNFKTQLSYDSQPLKASIGKEEKIQLLPFIDAEQMGKAKTPQIYDSEPTITIEEERTQLSKSGFKNGMIQFEGCTESHDPEVLESFKRLVAPMQKGKLGKTVAKKRRKTLEVCNRQHSQIESLGSIAELKSRVARLLNINVTTNAMESLSVTICC